MGEDTHIEARMDTDASKREVLDWLISNDGAVHCVVSNTKVEMHWKANDPSVYPVLYGLCFAAKARGESSHD